jgi:Peptidase A4 family
MRLNVNVGRWAAGIALGVVALALAPSARADTTTSSNWAGYAVHGSGVRFREASGWWREPNLTCSGTRTYSSIWVGLGGYATGANALEQVGTEADCSPSGHTLTSVWYELVPAASRSIAINVWPGDLIAAAVAVNGHRVTVTVADRTRGEFFRRTMYAPSLDVSSADWIVEAPSDCSGSCSQLPLADFGPVAFTRAAAVTTSGHAGRISNGAWLATRLVLTPGGRTFVSSGTAEASPSSLQAAGAAFTVRRNATVFSARAASSAAGSLMNPGR